MRRPPYGPPAVLWALLWALSRALGGALRALWGPLLVSACLCPPSDQALLSVGHHSPLQAFETFQTALRADLPDLEWRTLSSDFKRREGLSQLGYREFRETLFAEKPWLKLAARAKVLETLPIAPDRVRLVARVDTPLADRTFAVDLLREGFWEVADEEGVLAGELAEWDELAAVRRDRLLLALPMPAGVELTDVALLRAGREWKIDGFELLQDPPAPAP